MGGARRIGWLPSAIGFTVTGFAAQPRHGAGPAGCSAPARGCDGIGADRRGGAAGCENRGCPPGAMLAAGLVQAMPPLDSA
ncbi:MAG: hypothetical protein C0504_19425 [Candidatus Solibacter sp.]|nr:hypothetical protein [Candidatus Solibacter sp.]